MIGRPDYVNSRIRDVLREQHLQSERRDLMPSRRSGHVSFLNCVDRKAWHLKVIADRDRARGLTP